MKRIPIQSGELISVGYDAELQILEIEFSDHKIYQFISVTADVYASLMNATDKYQFYISSVMYQFAGQCISA